jgi:hypothetical protein
LSISSPNISNRTIAEELGVSGAFIFNRLKEYNIPIKPKGKAKATKNHCVLDDFIKDFIYEELLGGGTLTSNSKYSALYQHGSKYREYIEWLEKVFNQYGIQKIGRIYSGVRYTGSIVYSMCTKTYPELKYIYDMFYPDKVKIVPRNIQLTPTIVRQWYIGDGCLKKNRIQSLYNICY